MGLEEWRSRYGSSEPSPLERWRAKYGAEPMEVESTPERITPGTSAREVAERQAAEPAPGPEPKIDPTRFTRGERVVFDVLGPEAADTIREGQRELSAPTTKETAGLSQFIERGKKVGKVQTLASTALLGGAAAGEVTGALLPQVATGAGRVGAQVIGGAVGGATGQVAEDLPSNVPLRELPKRAADAGAFGALTAGAGGLLGEAARTKTGQAAIGWIRDKYGTLTRQLASKGAQPSAAVRAFGDGRKDAEHVLGFIGRHPEVDKALGNPDKVIASTQEVLDATKPLTKPIYAKFDQAAGEMPTSAVVALIDRELAPLQKAGKKPFRLAVEELKDEVIGEAQRMGTKSWSHERLREWATDARKAAKAKIGSIAETEGWEIVNEVDRVANKVLNTRLNAVAAAHPDLAPDLVKLRAANTDISAAVGLQELAENAQKVATYRPSRDLAAKGAGAIGLGLGGIPGAIASYGGAKAIGAATSVGARRAYAGAMKALADAVLSGKGVAGAAAAASAAGVPQEVVDGMIRRRQTPKEAR